MGVVGSGVDDGQRKKDTTKMDEKDKEDEEAVVARGGRDGGG